MCFFIKMWCVIRIVMNIVFVVNVVFRVMYYYFIFMFGIGFDWIGGDVGWMFVVVIG